MTVMDETVINADREASALVARDPGLARPGDAAARQVLIQPAQQILGGKGLAHEVVGADLQRLQNVARVRQGC